MEPRQLGSSGPPKRGKHQSPDPPSRTGAPVAQTLPCGKRRRGGCGGHSISPPPNRPLPRRGCGRGTGLPGGRHPPCHRRQGGGVGFRPGCLLPPPLPGRGVSPGDRGDSEPCLGVTGLLPGLHLLSTRLSPPRCPATRTPWAPLPATSEKSLTPNPREVKRLEKNIDLGYSGQDEPNKLINLICK